MGDRSSRRFGSSTARAAFAAARRAAGAAAALAGLLVAVAVLGQAAPATAAASDYEIGRGDVLKIVVVGEARLTGSFRVDDEGMLSFPDLAELPRVKAADLTLDELERKLATLLLAEGYLKRPQVSITVAEYGSQKVFVAGEVQKLGQYPLKADRTLLALLNDIGPLGPNAGHEVVVVRPPAVGIAAPAGPPAPASTAPADDGLFPAEPPATVSAPAAASAPSPAEPVVPGLPYVAPGSEIYRINLLELQAGNPEKNVVLRAGDTVFFPRAAQVYVMGSVSRPGAYRYEAGMTVLQALSLAGGVTERGSAGRAKVQRIVDGKAVETKARPTDLLQPEDTLKVPERFF